MISEARDAVVKGYRRLIMQLPTGAGKTASAYAIMKSSFEKGYRAIFFAHRRELVEQTARRFAQYGIEPTILMAGHEFDPSANLVIASQQTWEKRNDFLDGEYDLIFFDEAHIGVKRQQRIIKDIMDWGRNPVVIGLTATPMTNSGPGLGSIYQKLIHGPRLDKLIQDGYLVPPEYYIMQPLSFDPRKEIKINSMGEYDAEDVFRWFRRERIIGHVIQNYIDNFMGQRFILFARSIAQSVWVAEKFGEAGIPVAHIDYSTPDKERRRIIEEFRRGNIVGLTNVDIFSEGFDVPDVEVAILATPIGSVVRYIQRVGRVLRPAPGKEKAIVIDHGGVVQQHGTIYNFQEWILEPERPNRANPYHALKIKTPSRTRTCPICKTEFEVRSSQRECPKCGYDFYRLPPGVEPPIIPANMLKYEEWLRSERLGTKKTCSGVSLPLNMTPERFMRELLGVIDEWRAKKIAQGKKPTSKFFAVILYYATLCRCPSEDGIYRPLAMRPMEPGEWTRRQIKRFFILKNQGYFNWKTTPCSSKSKVSQGK